MQIGGNRFTQRQDAGGGCVTVMAVAQRLDGGFDDEIGRAKIGLADAEIDDVTALSHEMHGARQHRKGVLLADPVEGGNGLEHGISPTLFAGQFNPTAGQMQTASRVALIQRAPDNCPGL